MSIKTQNGVFTLTSILKGSVHAGNLCQAVTSLAFSELQTNLLQFLDDFLLHSRNEEALLVIIERFLKICRQRDFKVHAWKMELLRKTVKFCGPILDGDGITFDPRYLDCLHNKTQPGNAAELQQFLCTPNWIRRSLPDSSRQVAPLHYLMKSCYKKRRRVRRAQRLAFH